MRGPSGGCGCPATVRFPGLLHRNGPGLRSGIAKRSALRFVEMFMEYRRLSDHEAYVEDFTNASQAAAKRFISI